MAERVTYYVQPAQAQTSSGWEVRREGATQATKTGLTESEAEELAEEKAEDLWTGRGIPSEVVYRDLDGEFEANKPYGWVDG